MLTETTELQSRPSTLSHRGVWGQLASDWSDFTMQASDWPMVTGVSWRPCAASSVSPAAVARWSPRHRADRCRGAPCTPRGSGDAEIRRQLNTGNTAGHSVTLLPAERRVGWEVCGRRPGLRAACPGCGYAAEAAMSGWGQQVTTSGPRETRASP